MDNDELEVWSLYFIRCSAGPLKIGRAKDVKNRLDDLQVANPFDLTLIDGFVCGTRQGACELETFVHRKLSAFHMRGEWFGSEAEPYVARLIDLVRNRHRRSSVGTEIREGDWHRGLVEAPLKLSAAGRRGVQKTRAKRQFQRRQPSDIKRKAHTWFWRGQWRG